MSKQDKPINLPAMAKKSFDLYGNEPKHRKLLEVIYKKLKMLVGPFRRAKFIHSQINHQLDILFSNPVVKDNVSCSAGCAACCHTQVSITEDEAKLLAEKVHKKRTNIDKARLYKQSKAANDSLAWYKLSYQDRACVFLDEEGRCKVYEDRPSVCRTNNVFSDPKECETRDGKERPIRLLSTAMADMVVMAAFIYSKENGTLPNLLHKELKKFDRKFFPSEIDL